MFNPNDANEVAYRVGHYLHVLSADERPYPTGIWIANLRTGRQHYVSDGRDFSGVQVRPGGGNWLTCSRGAQTWSLNVRDGSLRQITFGPAHKWAEWSPDGQRLLGRQTRDVPNSDGSLWLLDATGQRIPAPVLEALGPYSRWSPDGQRLLVWDNPELSGWTLKLYNFGTTQFHPVALPPFRQFRGVAWLPDSQGLVWCSESGVFRTVLTTSSTTQLRAGCENKAYGSPVIAGNGQMLMVQRTDQRLDSDSFHLYRETNLWIMNLDGSNERKMVFRNSRQRK